MDRILAGIETEYGLHVEGRRANDQIEDAAEFVRSYRGPCFEGWDYRYESPRTDLRGYKVAGLAVDPVDAQFDVGSPARNEREVRADRVLPNGARFYNDHGHPEYATPETWSLRELALHDQAGERLVQRLAADLGDGGRPVTVYKNNTDYHGASYGTHENYLVPRSIGFEALYAAVTPMLVARQILCGAGKVGSDSGHGVAFQLSQRADFFTEPFNVDTLYRRPVFNTRDEPHADRAQWIRLHVISGDSNMIGACTARKVGLIKLAVALAKIGEAPQWRIADPVKAFRNISLDETGRFEIDLEGQSWTTGPDIIESAFAAAERLLDLDDETQALIAECRRLLVDREERPEAFERSVDWAAKRAMLREMMDAEGSDWNSPSVQAYDLEYHNLNPERGLFHALCEMGRIDDPIPTDSELEKCLEGTQEPTRAYARGLAVSKFGSQLKAACWRSLTFDGDGRDVEVDLDPDREYPRQLADAPDVETFIRILRGEA